MNKRQLHHLWTRFRLVKPWYFLIAALLCGLICLLALRANSQHMSELRDAVYTADRDNADVQKALVNLQSFVTAHMNTNLDTGNGVYPPIQLKYTYERLVQQRGSQLQSNNGDLYTQAQAYCQAQNPTDFSGRNRVPCIQQYVQGHGAPTSLTSPIAPSLYQFNFISPRWSPDLAGWSMIWTAIFLLLVAAKFVADRYLKRLSN